MDSLGMVYSGITNHNAQVATVDGSINYIYKDLVNLSAKSAYYHWMLKGDRSLLARAPRFDVDVDARVRILPQLHAYTNLKLVSFTYTKVVPRERSIIDWSLGANYTFNKRFSFFLDAHNLLNRRYSYYTGYPAQGFNVMAGAIVKF
jgi:predicted porin